MGGSVQDLIDASAPFWVAEAEVVRAYFEAPDRTHASDLAWLARQCHKELFDGVVRRLDSARSRLESLDAARMEESFASDLRVAAEELAHYQAFAGVYDALRQPSDPLLTYRTVRDDWAWPENAELGELRRRHREAHGELGVRACLFTEGGGGTLYEEGLKLRGRSATDDLVADACEKVHADEMGHMQDGLEHADLTRSELATLRDLTIAQLELRLPMRKAQFGNPLPAGDLLRAT